MACRLCDAFKGRVSHEGLGSGIDLRGWNSGDVLSSIQRPLLQQERLLRWTLRLERQHDPLLQ